MVDRESDRPDEVSDGELLRRRFLALAGAGTASPLLGADLASADPAVDGSVGTTDWEPKFYDDFEDGDYTSEPGWQIIRDVASLDVSVTDSSSPEGGSKALELSESPDSPHYGMVGWEDPRPGWDGEWTLSGSFNTGAAPLNRGFRHWINMGIAPDEGDFLRVFLGVRDDASRFAIDGPLIEDRTADHDVDWQAFTWYRYEVSHDGSGTYTGRIWTADEARPDATQAKSAGGVPAAEPRNVGIIADGGDARDYFRRTDGAYDSPDEGVLLEEFGTGWRIADWHQIEDLYAETGLSWFVDFLDEKFPSRGSSAFVTNGGRRYSDDYPDYGKQWYFATRWNGDKPDDWESLDTIRDHLLDLGSYNTNKPILAYRPSFEVYHGVMQWDDERSYWDEAPPIDLGELTDEKSELVDQIRGLAEFAVGDQPDFDRGEIDAEAEAFVEWIDAQEDLPVEQARQYEEALERMIAGEKVSRTAYDEILTPVGTDGKLPAEQFGHSVANAAVPVALGKVLDKAVEPVFRVANRKTSKAIIESQYFEDFYRGMDRQWKAKLGIISDAEEADRVYEAVTESQEELFEAWDASDQAAAFSVQKNALKGGQLFSTGESKGYGDLDYFQQVGEVKAGIQRWAKEQFHHSFTYRDTAPQPTHEVGSFEASIRDVPDEIEVPFSGEVQEAGEKVSRWIEDTAEDLGEFEELPTYELDRLEDVEFDLPEALEVPDFLSELPSEVSFEGVDLENLTEVLELLEAAYPLPSSGVSAELDEEIERLRDNAEEGELNIQDPETRAQVEREARKALEEVTEGAEIYFEAFDEFEDAGKNVENVTLGLLGANLVLGGIASLVGTSLVTLFLPVLGLLAEIIGLLNAMAFAADGLLGYAYFWTMLKVHTASVDRALNSDLSGIEGAVR